MNERMRELELEAIEYANSVTPANIRYNDIYYDVIRGKFAELIVKECLTVIKQSDDNCMSEWDYAERDLAGQIKEHFGVNE